MCQNQYLRSKHECPLDESEDWHVLWHIVVEILRQLLHLPRERLQILHDPCQPAFLGYSASVVELSPELEEILRGARMRDAEEHCALQVFDKNLAVCGGTPFDLVATSLIPDVLSFAYQTLDDEPTEAVPD